MGTLERAETQNDALVIVAQPKRPSFNSAIAEEIARGLKVQGYDRTELIDLYADGFDPVMPSEELPRKFSFDERTLDYQEKMMRAARVVFVYPDWWGGPPAILKGFLDRVFRPGIAYGFREADFRDADAPGLLGEKRFDVFITTDTALEHVVPTSVPEETDVSEPSGPVSNVSAEKAVELWPPTQVWKKNILEFCGVRQAKVHVFWNLRHSTYAERKAWLEGIPARLSGEA